MDRMYKSTDGKHALFPEGTQLSATQEDLGVFDGRSASEASVEHSELRAFHESRGFFDVARPEKDGLDARGFDRHNLHHVTGEHWDDSFHDYLGREVCPMYEIEHLLADAWYEYNRLLGNDSFAIPVTFVKDGQPRLTEWVPTFIGMLQYQENSARQLDGREMFMIEVVDAESVDSPIVRARARAAQQYSNVVGGALLALLFRKDGVFYVVDPEGKHAPLKSHVFNPFRRMTAAATQRKRLALELAGQGTDYAAMFRRLGLTDDEVATCQPS